MPNQKPDKKQKLTVKQEGFARDYVLTGNASEAYRRNYNAENMKQGSVAKHYKEQLKIIQKLRAEGKTGYIDFESYQ